MGNAIGLSLPWGKIKVSNFLIVPHPLSLPPPPASLFHSISLERAVLFPLLP